MNNTEEIVVWSIMAGGLLTVATVALADLAVSRSTASLRNVAFVLITCSCLVLLSGLPEAVDPSLAGPTLQVLKSGLPPVSEALALVYLSQWLGESAEDRWVYYTVVWGCCALVVAAAVMSTLAGVASPALLPGIVAASALINTLAVLLLIFVSVRAAQLGDQMAREMVVASLFLLAAVIGLHLHQMADEGLGLVAWLLTGFCAVTFFLLLVNLGIRHSRRARKLELLAGMASEIDNTSGLPQGSVLLAKVDDAFWRSARLNTRCTVVCLHLRNLYELSGRLGHQADQHILAAMTARIRRAVGFRCVVGLYQPRCFVIVISVVKNATVSQTLEQRLRQIVAKPLTLKDAQARPHIFVPRIGIGIVTANANSNQPILVVDEAERMAQAQSLEPDTQLDKITMY